MKSDSITYGSYCNLLPGAGLSHALCEYFRNSFPKVFGIFGNSIYPYSRVDLGSAALPALLIYPTEGRAESESWFYRGNLNMDMVLPGGAMVRQRSTEIATVLSEAVIFLILKNLNLINNLKYGAPDINGQPTWGKFPGLRDLGEVVTADFVDVNSLTTEQDSVTMRLKVTYTIDTVQWWDYIQTVLGHNVYEPCVYLYPVITDYLNYIELVNVAGNITEEVDWKTP